MHSLFQLLFVLIPGLPLLFGVNTSEKPLLLITQFHGVEGKCITLAKAQRMPLFHTTLEWAHIYTGIADAILYVHQKGLIHNDIKGDNVIIAKNSLGNYHPVLIDFGKCCKLENAKLYSLTKEEQRVYKMKYWHIAPELVRGTHKQSFSSDVYSFGVMLGTLKNKKLKETAMQCMAENPSYRLSITQAKECLSRVN